MKHSLSRLLATASLSLLMATSSLWAGKLTLKDEQDPSPPIQTSSHNPLTRKEEEKVNLLAKKVIQYPTISCDEDHPEEKLDIPTEVIFLIMDKMEPQAFGNFLVTSQSSFELGRDYLMTGRKRFTKKISSQEGIEAYRNSVLLGTLPHISFQFYDGRGFPEEATTALYSLAMKNEVLVNKDVRFLSSLRNLQILNLECNNLEEHVTVLAGLTNLHTLEVWWNNLREHVTALTALTNLRMLNVEGNNLGKHVKALTALTNLRTLDVRWNNLRQHVTELKPLTNTKILHD